MSRGEVVTTPSPSCRLSRMCRQHVQLWKGVVAVGIGMGEGWLSALARPLMKQLRAHWV